MTRITKTRTFRPGEMVMLLAVFCVFTVIILPDLKASLNTIPSDPDSSGNSASASATVAVPHN